MAEIKLSAEVRGQIGKGPSRRARADGKVPATVYGKGMDALSISVDRRDFITAITSEAGMNQLLDIQVDDDSVLALTRELQRDPVRGTLLHADFVKVDRLTKVDIEVPLHLVGEANGVANEGGILEQQLHELAIKCLPTEVPDFIEADVSALNIGDSLRVEDLSVSGDVEITVDVESVIALVSAPISEEELEALEAEAGIEQELPDEELEAQAESADGEEEEGGEAAEGGDDPDGSGEEE
jgi:large subunit ribosomal protein L25